MTMTMTMTTLYSTHMQRTNKNNYTYNMTNQL